MMTQSWIENERSYRRDHYDSTLGKRLSHSAPRRGRYNLATDVEPSESVSRAGRYTCSCSSLSTSGISNVNTVSSAPSASVIQFQYSSTTVYGPRWIKERLIRYDTIRDAISSLIYDTACLGNALRSALCIVLTACTNILAEIVLRYSTQIH